MCRLETASIRKQITDRTLMSTKLRIAGAPISWGVCEVPDWGYQLAPDLVLAQMSQLGLTATEFGPIGFLPAAPAARARELEKHQMKAVGGFYPVVLHDSKFDPLPEIQTELESFISSGAEILVLAASTGQSDYENRRPELIQQQWDTLFVNCDRISEYANSVGITATIHPHVGTMIETKSDVDKLLNGSTIAFTLDTGHLFIGGTDPVQFTVDHTNRIKHVHLKDVNLAVANRVLSGELTYNQGVKKGMYTPLGSGDVDIKTIVKSLAVSGYQGWYVLEQDLMLSGEPEEAGWPLTDAQASVLFLRNIEATLN